MKIGDSWYEDPEGAYNKTIEDGEKMTVRRCVTADSSEAPCRGPEDRYTSRSGCTVVIRCEGHQQLHDDRVREVEDGLNARYPGWDIPGSLPPDGFDPTFAGERWDDD